MATPLLHNVVDGEVLQASILRKGFAVSGFAHTWSASYYDIWLIAHDVCWLEMVRGAEMWVKFYCADLI